MKRKLILLFALLLPVALVSCGGSNPVSTTTPAPVRTSLQVVSSALLTTAQTVGDLNTAVINFNAQGLVSDDTTRSILAITTKIAQAGKQADALTLGLGQLAPTDKTKLLAVFTPILQAVNDSLSNGLVTIKDPNTLATIKLALASIQGVLSGVQVALAGSN